MKCPNCGSDASGAFCSECGSPLKGAKCRECNSPLPAGAKFCTNCGTPVAARARAVAQTPSKAPWFVAGGALLLVTLVLLWPSITGSSDDRTGRVPLSQIENPGGASVDGAPAPLTGSPREQADRLFNRIMTERESGDSAKVNQFLPMGIQAYQLAGDLDADGLYHLSLLQALNRDYAASRSTAEQILANSPNHLLALSAAANAARNAGDKTAARKYYQQFLSAYDAELKTKKQEYEDHGRMLPELRAEAEQFVK
jgi:double zinc ribbon protein